MTARAQLLDRLEELLPAEAPGIAHGAAHELVGECSPLHVRNTLRDLAKGGRADLGPCALPSRPAAALPARPRMKGPWFITEEAAAAREAEALRYQAALVERCIVEGMPMAVVLIKLARLGITAADWLRLKGLGHA